MPLHACEAKFFNWLHQNNETRDKLKQLRVFVDDPAEIDFQDIKIPDKSGYLIRVRHYHATEEIKPLIIFFPGNGFIYDLFEENHAIISKIAKYSGCHAVMVDYRLAPLHPYPAPLKDALKAVQYVFAHLDFFKANKKKIILAGYSSGANLAAVITNQLRKHQDMPIFHQLLISGAYDYTNSLHDYDDYGMQDRFLSPAEAQFSFDAYCQASERSEPTCSPYWEKDLSQLPPTTIMMGEYDGGRSQSEGYAKKLIAAGNVVTKLVLPGQTHSTILYRKALSEGEDPALVAARQIKKVVS